MGLLIDRVGSFLGFYQKPRDAAVTGLPLTSDDQLVLFSRNRTTPTTGINVFATVFNPENGRTRTFPAIAAFSTSGTVFAGETAQFSTAGMFSDGELLTSVLVATASITDPTQFWCAVELFRQGRSAAWLCEGYTHGSHAVSWCPGYQGGLAQSALANPAVQGALFTFQGTVVNGAGGAGNNSLTIVPPSGGRFRVLAFQATNNDTSARTADILIQDTSTGNDLTAYITGLSLSAGQSANLPVTNAQASNAPASGLQNVWIAGGNEFFAVIAAVAASQDTAWACILEVFGGAPTLTLAGASTPTLTTNISRFETG